MTNYRWLFFGYLIVRKLFWNLFLSILTGDWMILLLMVASM